MRGWTGELGRQEKREMRWCQKEGSAWIQGESSHLHVSELLYSMVCGGHNPEVDGVVGLYRWKTQVLFQHH